MSEKLTKLMKNTSSGDWQSGMVNGTRFEIIGGENFDKTIAFVFNEVDADFITGCKTEVPKLISEIERLKKVALDILEEYDSSERRVIDEVSTNRKLALHMHEAYLRDCKNEIEGGNENE